MSFVAIGVGIAAIGTGVSIASAINTADQNEKSMAMQKDMNDKALADQNNRIAANKQSQVTQAQSQANLQKTFAGAGRSGTILTNPLGGIPNTTSANPSANLPANAGSGTKTVLGA